MLIHIFHNTHSMNHYNDIKKGNVSQSISHDGIKNIFKNLLSHICIKKKQTGLMRDFMNFI